MKPRSRFRITFACTVCLLGAIIPSVFASEENRPWTPWASWTPSQAIGHSSWNVVYLTFDDGPSLLYTPQILAVLRREGVHATFFVLGSRVTAFPRITKRIAADGNEIGNHGFQHDYPSRKDAAWLVSDIRKTDGAIRQIIGARPVYYRPPGGMITPVEIATIQSLGHPLALWTVDARDWDATTPQQITEEVLKHARPGSIILMHDGVSQSRFTAVALPTIIHQLRRRGYQFATLPFR